MQNYYAFEFDSATQQFTKRTKHLGSLETDSVLIEVTCSTICGSDLHTFCGRRPAPPSCVLGHEIIGNIADWQSTSPPTDFSGASLEIGDRVTWAMAVGCGNCFYCTRQLSQKCESLYKYGHESGNDGVPTGGLSQYCQLVPGTPIFKIPETLPDEVACPANCATATVAAGMRIIAETHPIADCNALVTGAGMLGLTATAQLKTLGARKILIGDINGNRLRLARSFGATHCLNLVNPTESISEILNLTDGRGVDIVLDFAGVLPAVEFGIDSVRTGGCVLLAGSVFPTAPLSRTPESIIRRMLTVRGLHNYLPKDLAAGLSFLETHHQQFPFKDLVSKNFALEQCAEAFSFARDHQPVRIAIRPNPIQAPVKQPRSGARL